GEYPRDAHVFSWDRRSKIGLRGGEADRTSGATERGWFAVSTLGFFAFLLVAASTARRKLRRVVRPMKKDPIHEDGLQGSHRRCFRLCARHRHGARRRRVLPGF